MSLRAVFVAGAHTEIGKTHVACALLEAARAEGRSVEALKPVVSGFDPTDWAGSDPGRLLAALGRPLTPETLEAISPWRLAAPLAPPMAAKLEGWALPLAPIVAFCRQRIAASQADLVLVEGVGGLMSPIADGETGIDLMQGLGAPSILVGGAYLGGISHLLTALETLRCWGGPPRALVVSQDPGPDAPDFAETVECVRSFASPLPVIAAPRSEDRAWAKGLLELL